MPNNMAMQWARFVPIVSYHHILMIGISIAIILLSVLLAGCTSDGMSGVYLMSLQYNAPNTPIPTLPGEVNAIISHAVRNASQASGDISAFTIRAGYRGICMGRNDDISRLCSSNTEALARMARVEKKTIGHGNTSTDATVDPLNLIMITEEFRQKIIFDGFIYLVIALCFFAFILLSTFPGWHEETDEGGSVREVKPFPSRPVLHIAFSALFAAFAFCFVSVLWQHINSSSTTSMVETLTYGAVSGHVGFAAMALGWVAVGLIGSAGFGIFIMILSIRLITTLSDEESEASS